MRELGKGEANEEGRGQVTNGKTLGGEKHPGETKKQEETRNGIKIKPKIKQ